MHKIVCNTTPIISLLKINKFSLLRDVYGKIIVPKEVFLEIEKGKSKPYYIDISQAEWIDIKEIQDKKALHYFVDLDAREAEVIVLATEIGADLAIFGQKIC